jgi:hypothetical protein
VLIGRVMMADKKTLVVAGVMIAMPIGLVVLVWNGNRYCSSERATDEKGI